MMKMMMVMMNIATLMTFLKMKVVINMKRRIFCTISIGKRRRGQKETLEVVGWNNKSHGGNVS